ncbi:MAG: DUF934 domain-containing protein [Sphingomonadales bacterium]
MRVKFHNKSGCGLVDILEQEPSPKTISLEDFLARPEDFQKKNSFVLRIGSDQDVEPLKKWLKDIPGIELEFPKFTDGRAFSKAYRLKKYYGFMGELWAVGEILPDQVLFLVRCGFDGVNFKEPVKKETLVFLLNKFSYAYQGAVDEHISLTPLEPK